MDSAGAREQPENIEMKRGKVPRLNSTANAIQSENHTENTAKNITVTKIQIKLRYKLSSANIKLYVINSRVAYRVSG